MNNYYRTILLAYNLLPLERVIITV